MTQAEKYIQEKNTENKTFVIIEGWGESSYLAKSKYGLRSNPYKAVNHSIALEKAIMVCPDHDEVETIHFNGECIYARTVWPFNLLL